MLRTCTRRIVEPYRDTPRCTNIHHEVYVVTKYAPFGTCSLMPLVIFQDAGSAETYGDDDCISVSSTSHHHLEGDDMYVVTCDALYGTDDAFAVIAFEYESIAIIYASALAIARESVMAVTQTRVVTNFPIWHPFIPYTPKTLYLEPTL